MDSITGIFETFLGWLRETFSWIFDAIGDVSSTVGKLTWAVSAAWNKAFDDAAPAEAAQKSAPVAAKAQEQAAAQAAAKTVERPQFKVVSPAAVSGGGAPVTGKAKSDFRGGKGRRAGSGAGSGRGSSTGSNGGPVTVVTQDGSNAAPQTLFFPAGGRASMGAAAASQVARAAAGSLPRQGSRAGRPAHPPLAPSPWSPHSMLT